jgi:hypothetical protein
MNLIYTISLNFQKSYKNKRLGFNFRTTDRPPFTMLAYRFEFDCIQLFICEHFQLMLGQFLGNKGA